MRPLDFEEFLWALGYDDVALDVLRGCYGRLEPVPQAVHTAMVRRVREDLAIGSRDARVEPVEVKASRGSTAPLNALLSRDDIVRGAVESPWRSPASRLFRNILPSTMSYDRCALRLEGTSP